MMNSGEQTVELNGIKVTKAQLEAGLLEFKQRESNPKIGDKVIYRGDSGVHIIGDPNQIGLDKIISQARKYSGRLLLCLENGHIGWEQLPLSNYYRKLGPCKGFEN